MIDILRHFVSSFWITCVPARMNRVPTRLIGVPMLLAGLPLLFATGCVEPVQDASTPPASSSTSPPPSPEAVYLTSETTASMNLPFSNAVRMGHLLFLSGQIGNIPGTTDPAPGGIQGEARQTMENIRTVLEANGSSMDRVIKATVMLAGRFSCVTTCETATYIQYG